MTSLPRRVLSALSDVTLGTLIVLFHLSLAERQRVIGRRAPLPVDRDGLWFARDVDRAAAR